MKDGPLETNGLKAGTDNAGDARRKAIAEAVNQRAPLFHADMPFLLHWSEKSGCTASIKWFFDQIGLLEEALEHHPWIHVYENDVYKARPGYRAEMIGALVEGRPSIKVIRDPMARCFSGYLELCRNHLAKRPVHWATSCRIQIIKDLTGDFAGMEQGFSFAQYLDWLAEQDLQQVNPHIAPQICLLDEVVSMEYFTIDSFFERIYSHPLGRELEKREVSDKIKESTHHHAKKPLSKSQTLSVLNSAIPLLRTPEFPIPEVSVRTIGETEIGAKLKSIFGRDLEVYRNCLAVEKGLPGAAPST